MDDTLGELDACEEEVEGGGRKRGRSREE